MNKHEAILQRATTIAVCTALLGSISGCIPKELSEKPPRQATSVTLDTRESAIGAEVGVALSDIRTLVDARIRISSIETTMARIYVTTLGGRSEINAPGPITTST